MSDNANLLDTFTRGKVWRFGREYLQKTAAARLPQPSRCPTDLLFDTKMNNQLQVWVRQSCFACDSLWRLNVFSDLVGQGYTLRLLILADLRLDEITDVELLRVLWEKIASAGKDADALIIAGDLADAAVSHCPGAIRWLGKHYSTQQTVFILGNHDNMCRVRNDSLMMPD